MPEDCAGRLQYATAIGESASLQHSQNRDKVCCSRNSGPTHCLPQTCVQHTHSVTATPHTHPPLEGRRGHMRHRGVQPKQPHRQSWANRKCCLATLEGGGGISTSYAYTRALQHCTHHSGRTTSKSTSRSCCVICALSVRPGVHHPSTGRRAAPGFVNPCKHVDTTKSTTQQHGGMLHHASCAARCVQELSSFPPSMEVCTCGLPWTARSSCTQLGSTLPRQPTAPHSLSCRRCPPPLQATAAPA